MNYNFAPITEEHLSEVREIYNHYIKNSIATLYAHEMTLDDMRKKVFFTDEKYGTFVVQDGDNLLGYCMLSPFDEREGYARTAEISIYLKPSQTGKGIGKDAIAFLESKAKAAGIRVLLAWVTMQNEASMKLMEKCGYEKTGILKQVGEKFGKLLDDVYFEKVLE